MGFAARLLLPILALLAFASPAAAQLLKPQFSAILLAADTGEVLYASEADEKRAPASITKMMTLYLTFQALESGTLRLDDDLVISRFAASRPPSKLGLRAGQTIKVEDAIKVIAVKSANDLAVALAERLDGSEEKFAERMTREARRMGMRNTTFRNASGLPKVGHVSSARDIALLSRRLIAAYPRYYTYFGTRTFDFGRMRFASTNKLLGRGMGVDGIKTGFTYDAGYTLAASAVRDGRRLIAVVLGEPSSRARDADIAKLIDTGFDALEREQKGVQMAAVHVEQTYLPTAYLAATAGRSNQFRTTVPEVAFGDNSAKPNGLAKAETKAAAKPTDRGERNAAIARAIAKIEDSTEEDEAPAAKAAAPKKPAVKAAVTKASPKPATKAAAKTEPKSSATKSAEKKSAAKAGTADKATTKKADGDKKLAAKDGKAKSAAKDEKSADTKDTKSTTKSAAKDEKPAKASTKTAAKSDKPAAKSGTKAAAKDTKDSKAAKGDSKSAAKEEPKSAAKKSAKSAEKAETSPKDKAAKAKPAKVAALDTDKDKAKKAKN